MKTQDPTIAKEHDPEQTLTELTLCLSQTYAARGRIHLDRDHLDLALADLDESLRLDPDNTEAQRLRTIVRRTRMDDFHALDVPDQSEGNRADTEVGGRFQTRFRAGYLVSARCHADDHHTDQPLVLNPLTALGRDQAIEFARHMCSKESKSWRNQLYDAYWTDGVDFDTVVTEFRSLVRQIHLEKAVDDDGEPVID